MPVYPLLKRPFFIFAVVHTALVGYAAAVSARDYTVALVPFRTNAEENIGYIENGVRDMIRSRLSYKASLTLVEQGLVEDALSNSPARELSREKLLETGRAVQADYVIGGSISKMGSTLSIDVTILNVMKGGATSSVFTQGLGLDEVIPHMKVLAQEIADTIYREGRDEVREDGEAQPPAGAETVLEEQVQESAPPVSSDEAVDSPQAVKTGESPGSVRERLLRRESDIDAGDENPVYQKSIDDLKSVPVSPGGEEEGGGTGEEMPPPL